jgi:DNA-binding SARP family transcriptional activator
MLANDPCQEQAHLRLMQCYYRQGYPYLAIRQYHMCAEKLKTELDLPPSQQTTALFNAIRLGKCDLPLV